MGLFDSASALSVLCSSHTRWNVSSLLPARLLRKRAEVAANGSVNGRSTLRSSTESRDEEVIVALTCADRMRALAVGRRATGRAQLGNEWDGDETKGSSCFWVLWTAGGGRGLAMDAILLAGLCVMLI